VGLAVVVVGLESVVADERAQVLAVVLRGRDDVLRGHPSAGPRLDDEAGVGVRPPDRDDRLGDELTARGLDVVRQQVAERPDIDSPGEPG